MAMFTSASRDHAHLHSYQHCTELEKSFGDGFDGSRCNTSESPSSFQVFKRIQSSRAAPVLLLALCLTVALHASEGPSLRRPRGPPTTLGATTSRGHDLLWSDEFDGDALDVTKWTAATGDGCAVGLCGWGNGEREVYAPANACVADGVLTLEARRAAAPGGPAYTSAKIVSRGKAEFGLANGTVGVDGGDVMESGGALYRSRRFEASLQLPWGRGIWPAFWMLPTRDTFGGWPRSGEIDIMENIGKEGANTVHGTVHYGGPGHQYSEAGITLMAPPAGGLNDTFHRYAVERVPGAIRWYVDDVEYAAIAARDVHPYRWTFDEEFHFILCSSPAVAEYWDPDLIICGLPFMYSIRQ